MSNLIGIYVKRQPGDPYDNNWYPKEPLTRLNDQFFEFLDAKFPLTSDTWSAGVSKHGDSEIEFWIQPIGYGKYAEEKGLEVDDLWLAMVEFIFQKFSHIEGIEMKTYWSG